MNNCLANYIWLLIHTCVCEEVYTSGDALCIIVCLVVDCFINLYLRGGFEP
jgi:hypothetical protein